MGSGKEWAIVGLVGVVTFASLLLLPDGNEGGTRGGTQPSTILEVFLDHVRSDGPTQVLFVDHETAHRVHEGTFFSWRTPQVAVGTTEAVTPGCQCVGSMFHVAPGPQEPRLGRGGYNATVVTAHVFDADGELVFSNGNASEQARLRGTLSPQQLPQGTWYLGANATAPPGTQMPPAAARAFLSQARSLIEGLPVGGVATTETDALAAWYGTLYITLHVDGLVHAP